MQEDETNVFLPGTLATLGAFIVTFVDDLDLDVDGGRPQSSMEFTL